MGSSCLLEQSLSIHTRVLQEIHLQQSNSGHGHHWQGDSDASPYMRYRSYQVLTQGEVGTAPKPGLSMHGQGA